MEDIFINSILSNITARFLLFSCNIKICILLAGRPAPTAVGVSLFVVSPVPSCPLAFEPQQLTVPPDIRAQVCASPKQKATPGESSVCVCGV